MKPNPTNNPRLHSFISHRRQRPKYIKKHIKVMAKYVHIKKYIKKSSQTHQKHITTHQILKHIKLYIKSTCAHQTGTSNILMCF